MSDARFDHDCGRCTYLGRNGDEDAYACMQGASWPTTVLRFGHKPEDYRSGMHLFSELPPDLQDAARSWLAADPDVQIILKTLLDAGGSLPFEQLEHRYYQRGGS